MLLDIGQYIYNHDSQGKNLKLSVIYLYICDLYDNELKYLCQRFTNNDHSAFSDQELKTIYLYVMHVEQKIKIKQIHNFVNNYLLSWFSRLPGYLVLNNTGHAKPAALDK